MGTKERHESVGIGAVEFDVSDADCLPISSQRLFVEDGVTQDVLSRLRIPAKHLSQGFPISRRCLKYPFPPRVLSEALQYLSTDNSIQRVIFIRFNAQNYRSRRR